jgi:hypothetical protein
MEAVAAPDHEGVQVEQEVQGCGHPTRTGAPCRRPPLAGAAGRCSRHAGLPATKAERDAARIAALRHGYYVGGFLDEAERELFQRIVAGEVPPTELQRQAAAALFIRAMRMTQWESEDGEASPLTTAAFSELRQTLEAHGTNAIVSKMIQERSKQAAGVDA